MRAVDIIMDKRTGKELSPEAIEFLIRGYVAGEIPEYQVAAWAMAVVFQGMTAGETAALTQAMLHSGKVMDLSGIAGPLVDKHSTGGVGDKTSLILAPLAAALGIRVPMMSGRALGHTGGTLDKLDAIPGYRTALTEAEFRRVLTETGFALTGQTREIVPADRLLYALRDVTATVDSIPLITASILSKKIAEGAEALVLDVKFGAGAFMRRPEDARALARSLVDTGQAMGKRVVALLTDMDEPLGNKVGNFLEIEEVLDCLEGRGPADLMEVTLELGARMAMLGGKAPDAAAGRRLCEAALAGGEPLERFYANVAAQGGDGERLRALRGNYRAPCRGEVRAERGGFIARLDAGQVGRAAVALGVGRSRTDDAVSPGAGVFLHAKAGASVSAGDLLMTCWAQTAEGLSLAAPVLAGALSYADAPPAPRHLVQEEMQG